MTIILMIFLVTNFFNIKNSKQYQADLEKMAGVRRETIVFLEKEKYNPSPKPTYKIAKAINTTIEEFFLFDEDKL